jgi:iron complex outermembrane receptor protein
MFNKIKLPVVTGACCVFLGVVTGSDASAAASNGDQITVAADAGNNASNANSSASSIGSKKKASMGMLGKQDTQEVPYSVQALPQDVMNQQQLKDITQVYRYLPSVQGEGTRPQSRGIQGSVIQNFMIDGLYAVSTTPYAVEQFQQMEVLNGLGGSLYGPANPAGMFNMVSKRPTYTTQNSLTLGMGTGLSEEAGVDLSGPLDDAKRIRYRLNLLDDQGGSYTDGSKKRRQLASLALDFQLTDKTVLETNFSYYHYLDRGLPGSFGIASGVSFPTAMNPTQRNLGQTYAGNDDHTLTTSFHLKHDFDGNWQSDVGFLHQIADRNSTAVTNSLTDKKGDYKTTVSNTTASEFVVNSYMATLNGTEYTGWLQHDLSVGLRGFSWGNYNPVNGSTATLGSANLSNMTSFNSPSYPDFGNRYHSATSTQESLMFGDTLTFSPQWSVLLAGSESHLTTANYAKTNIQTSASQNDGFSGSSSLMYKPLDNLMFYTTYADSLQQGDVAPSGSSNVGQITAPYRSRQIEVGSKWTVGKTNLSAALFQIKRPFAYTESNGYYGIAGEQRNRGLELMADSNLTDNLHLYGGITYLDPKLLNTGTASTSNKQIVGLSRVTANLLTVYQIPGVDGLDVDGNIHFVGRRPTDNADSTWVSSYTVFDVGTSYRTKLFNTTTTFRFDMLNLTDKFYWTNVVPGALTGYTGTGTASAQLGAPRTAEISMKIDF